MTAQDFIPLAALVAVVLVAVCVYVDYRGSS